NERAHDRSPFAASADQRRSPGKAEGNRCGGPIHPERRRCLRRAFVFLRRVERLPAARFPPEDNAPVRRYACPNLVVARLSGSGLKRLAPRCLVDPTPPLRDSKTFVQTMGIARKDKQNASSRFSSSGDYALLLLTGIGFPDSSTATSVNTPCVTRRSSPVI